MKLFDSHCHLSANASRYVSILIPENCLNFTFGLMGTKPDDWDACLRLSETFPEHIRPGLGLHPWYASTPGSEMWLCELRNKLIENKRLIVGEIGLDKASKCPETGQNNIEEQFLAFRSQIELATELNRPVSIHSVRAHGLMMDYFRSQDNLPPAINLHSFGGTIGTAQSYFRMKKFGSRFYFGFSHVINSRSEKTKSVISSIPDDRILLESDLEIFDHVEDNLLQMLRVISECKNWSLEQAAIITFENAERFYSHVDKD